MSVFTTQFNHYISGHKMNNYSSDPLLTTIFKDKGGIFLFTLHIPQSPLGEGGQLREINCHVIEGNICIYSRNAFKTNLCDIQITGCRSYKHLSFWILDLGNIVLNWIGA